MSILDIICEKVSAIKNGTMARVQYKSELPVKACYKKEGISIIKMTDATVRFGVDYDHIAKVIEQRAEKVATYETTTPRANNFYWIIENKVSHNTNTNKDYLRFARVNGGSHRHTLYKMIVGGDEKVVEKADIEEYVQNSYWNKHSEPEVQNICIDNVISINGAVIK